MWDKGRRMRVRIPRATEKRIKIMLRIWGRAPLAMITGVPEALREAVAREYMRRHPNTVLVGDEIRLRGRG